MKGFVENKTAEEKSCQLMCRNFNGNALIADIF